MSSSNRGTPAHTSPASSELSTPVSRRRRSSQIAHITSYSTTASASVSSPRTVRRLQSKSKTVRWRKSSYNDSPNESVGNSETTASQHQKETITEDLISTMSDESDADLIPSTIMGTLSLSHSHDNDNNSNNSNNNTNANNNNNNTNTNNNNNNNNTNNNNINNDDDDYNNNNRNTVNNQTSISDNGPAISDMEENIDHSTNHGGNIKVNRKKQEDMVKLTALLTFFEQSQDGTTYVCKTCQAKLKKQRRSAANLRRHLGNVHGETVFMYQSQLKDVPNNNLSIPHELKQQLDEKQINATIIDSRPFGDFSRKGLREFLATAIPGYKPLHRTTVRNRLHMLYNEHRRKLRQILANVSDLALTTDIWKDSRNRFFISLTGHYYDQNFKLVSLILSFRLLTGSHIGDRLAKYIKNEIIALNIEQKVRSITTDNAPNIVKAVKKLGMGIHISCMAHNLNLIIKSTLFPKKKKKPSSLPKSTTYVDDETETDEPSMEDDASVDDYSSSDEATTSGTSDERRDRSISSQQSSNSEDNTSTSSDDEEIIDSNLTNNLTDPVLLRIRSLIKRVRGLVRLVNRSGPLSEYIRVQAKERKLPGEVSDERKVKLVKIVQKRFIELND
ncbi:unnamed protein product [Rotaria socialis]|uniref:BED-type domain-containing protein n=1 Tax=Rotaria socialis TaxID=392032 RepID=A0A817MSY2_9BILA|nr:unnamed protein product [Rotaria socialis]CAF4429804.1 unnamed protein product [Rotaria socialis]